ncbi:MAG: LppX_LprAFG lipoprotein [Acidimicrobiia bacterium]|nr:LppX_LprAFG lipoprotein [Acidimicrobiia bacterium]
MSTPTTMPSPPPTARASRRAIALVTALVLVLAACGGEDLGGEPMPEDVAVVLPAAAAAMGDVTSVRFALEPSGAVVYIDTVGSLSLDEIDGRFSAPSSAEAILTVTIDGNLSTKLGAVAIDEIAWLSNPVTGTFEELPASYGIDPSNFFDPQDGWRPLLTALQDPVFVGTEQRDGTRYHIRATAPAEQMTVITAGLVSGQDVELDLWIHPVSGLVTAAEFATDVAGERTAWALSLTEYGKEITIEPPVDG